MDDEVILEWSLDRENGVIWNGLIWLRVGIGGRLL
jgi:hypothetical protein